MSMHEAEWSMPSAHATLLTHGAVDLFMSWVIAETLTTPCGHILLLRQRLLCHPQPVGYLNLQPLEQTPVRPVCITPTPVALLRPFALGAMPPFVVGAVALPAETGVWGVIEAWHLERSPRSKPEGLVGRRVHQPHSHCSVGVHKCLIEAGPLHPVLDGADCLLHIEPHTSESHLLLMEIVELLLDLDLQLEFLTKTQHLCVDVWIF